MLDHHIQRTIIYKLAFTPKATFSELKPDYIENKLFTYHLKKTVISGYVQKGSDGHYSLTPEGRRLSTGVLEKQQALAVERPLSALFLIVRRKLDGKWLLYTRKTHPMLGYSGFMHVRPNASQEITEIASEQFESKTGLRGKFTPLGGGYIKIFNKESLESYTHFTLLYCNDVEGELTSTDTHAAYFWVDHLESSNKKMLPPTQLLKELFEKGEQFFIDETFTI